MMAYKLLEAMRTGQSMPLFNGGNMYRDWTFVGDIVSGVVAAVEIAAWAYEVIKLVAGEPVLVIDFVKALEKLAGKQAPLTSEPMMRADVSYTFANIDKAKKLPRLPSHRVGRRRREALLRLVQGRGRRSLQPELRRTLVQLRPGAAARSRVL